MAMTGDGLFAAVVAALGVAQDGDIQEAALKPICQAIVTYIQTNAIVTVVGVQTGGSSAGGTIA